MLDGLAGRQIIKHGVAERALPGGKLGEHRPGGGTLDPVQHGVGPFGADQGVVQHPQFRADLPAGAGEELAELPAQLAATADPGQQAPAGAAARAGLPETLIRHRAAGAQRRLAGAGQDGGQLPAARAFRLPAGTRAAPRLTGGLRRHAGRGPPTHAAGRDRPGDARRADRPFRQARADAATPSAAGAFFQADRVADQAVRAQRLAAGVPGSRLADRPAAAAGHRGGLGDAVAAAPLPVQAAVQAAAMRAGRPGDLPGSGGAQLVDQPQHRRGGRLRALAGKQARIGLYRPRQPAQVALAGEHPPGGIGDRAGGQRRIQPGDDPGENGQRVALVTVRAPVTARLVGPVAAGNGPPLAARCARPQRQPPHARAAIPVLTVALDRGDLAVAGRTPQRADPGCPSRAQREQQVPDDRGSRRPAAGQQRRIGGQRRGQPAAPGPPAAGPLDGRADRILVNSRIDRGYHRHRGRDRIGEHVAGMLRHREAIRARFGRRFPTPAPPAPQPSPGECRSVLWPARGWSGRSSLPP